MDLLNSVKSRYTTKAYNSEKKIPQEKINKLLEILRFTPSSVNIQPWHFVVADNLAAKEQIAKSINRKVCLQCS